MFISIVQQTQPEFSPKAVFWNRGFPIPFYQTELCNVTKPEGTLIPDHHYKSQPRVVILPDRALHVTKTIRHLVERTLSCRALLAATDKKEIILDTILLFRWDRGWQFPLVGNTLSPSPKQLLLGMVCVGVYGIHE